MNTKKRPGWRITYAVVVLGLTFCVVDAATLSTEVYVDFDGSLAGTDYTLGPSEIDTTATFAAHNGTEIVTDGLGILTDAGESGQESFQFDASSFNNNGTEFTGTAFVVEAIFTHTGGSADKAPVIDIGGQCFIRNMAGRLSAGSWNGAFEDSYNRLGNFPSVGVPVHYAIVYDGASTIDYYVDGVRIFQSNNGSPQEITPLISWGNIRHTTFDGGRPLIGQYDSVAFSTFTGTFDPGPDFILFDLARLLADTGNGLEVHEGKYHDSYSLRLSREPIGEVRVQIFDTSDPNQVIIEPTILKFTSDNWQTDQILTITAVEDGIPESDIHSTIIRHVISSDTDQGYDRLNNFNLLITIHDDECGQWGYQAADINKDCRVDLEDLALLAQQWCTCTLPYVEGCINLVSDDSQLAKPSSDQVVWHDCELGMFIHYSINTYLDQEWDTDPQMSNLWYFNPGNLDTDEWVAAAEAMGAKYIVFVAKHVGGFCMWQTDTSEYSIKNTPYKNGYGDILSELVVSCQARGMNLGVYISPQDRFFGAGVGGITFNPADQESYNSIYRAQLTEVLRDYGPFMEVWFDGNIIVPVVDILQQYAPHAMVFQCPGGATTIRWVGNENGYCPYPAWNAVPQAIADAGTGTAADSDPDGDAWVPIECDARTRNTWFWRTNNAGTLKSVGSLMSMYYNCIGHGAVLLLNMTPDPTGAFPQADVNRVTEFGQEIKRRFEKPIAETHGTGYFVTLELPEPNTINHVVLMEDITQGERVREYIVEGFVDGEWQNLCSGTAIGHKKIDVFFAVENVTKVRFHCTQAAAEPIIRKLAVYNI